MQSNNTEPALKNRDVVSQENVSILIVDDNEMNRDMLSRRLERQGYIITTAESGVQAKSLIEKEAFDLVLLDIMMPVMNGLQVLKWLREESKYADVVVIMTTAKNESNDIVEALASGADDYVSKPIDFPVLLARIERQLSRKYQVKALRNSTHDLEQQVRVKTSKTDEASSSGQVERKYVTVLFCDLSGYTAMSEKLDPEEVKEIMSAVLGSAHEVITHYGGVIEKFLGDAVMAVFGKRKTYEDDPVRAIRAVMEIHKRIGALEIVDSLKRRIGTELSMHSGINTGVVITNPGTMKEGAETILGDAVNLASRLTSLAKTGEILVSSGTYQLAQGYFNFEEQEAVAVKGKSRHVRAYKVISAKSRPSTIRRLSGHRSKLVGRSTQLNDLKKACDNMLDGAGSTFLIYGPIGTGKSRLIGEFREGLEPGSLQWLQGNAYQNFRDIPYSLFINFLRRLWSIEESDPPETIRGKLAEGIGQLMGDQDITPYIGHLFGLDYAQTEKISPQFWKLKFVNSIRSVVEVLNLKKPSIICFEDIQWADNASLDLLRSLITNATHHGLLVCTYTTPFHLFTDQEHLDEEKTFQEIKLFDLSHSEVEVMLRSLLNTNSVPEELTSYIEENVGGNPFYIEELVNSLVESGVLLHDEGKWRLNSDNGEPQMPSSIQGVISARLYHLDNESREVLQEAAAIGKKFQYTLLKRITRQGDTLDQCLERLERSDLIRVYSMQPDLEYVFKHALIQEVVYDSLLISDRGALHKLVAETIESDFAKHLADYYEILACHYHLAKLRDKTVDYLQLSAEKSLTRHAVEEAHHYFKDAFDLLIETAPESKEAQKTLAKLLTKWAVAHFFRGDFKGLLELFNTYREMAESLGDQPTLGFYYAWYGKALYYNDRNEEAYKYLTKALQIGELTDNAQIIGYACSSLLFTCKERGSLDEATVFGKRSLRASREIENDPVVLTRTLVGLGDVYFFRGNVSKVLGVANMLFKYADKHPASGQAVTSSHMCIGLAHSCSGNFAAAIESFENAIRFSVSPFFSQWPKLWLANACILNGQFEDAEKTLGELVEFCRANGVLNLITLAEALSGVILCHKEQLQSGLKMIKRSRDVFRKKGLLIFFVYCEYFLGKVYLQMAQQALHSADHDAESRFTTVIQEADDMGAAGLSGPARLELAHLYKLSGNSHKAKDFYRAAIKQFRECEATTYMDMASHELQILE